APADLADEENLDGPRGPRRRRGGERRQQGRAEREQVLLPSHGVLLGPGGAPVRRQDVAHRPGNTRMWRPPLLSVRYMRPFTSTKQSFDWVTSGRFGRGSMRRLGSG